MKAKKRAKPKKLSLPKVAKSIKKQLEFGKNYGKKVKSIAKALPQPKMQPLPKPAKRVKANPVGKVIKATKLSNRTKVTPEQLERIQGMEGGGVASTYNEQGEKELSLIRKLSLAKRKAPKFVLYTDQLGRRLYIGDRALLKYKPKDQTAAITFDIKQALQFIEGFDNPSVKIAYFNINGAGLQFKSAKLFNRSKLIQDATNES